jgi:hypothetical protein
MNNKHIDNFINNIIKMILLKKGKISAIYFIVLFLVFLEVTCKIREKEKIGLNTNKKETVTINSSFMKNIENSIVDYLNEERSALGLTTLLKNEVASTRIELDKCSRFTCSPLTSYCLNSHSCVCKKGYITIIGNEKKTCNYKMKKQVIALFLELFLPFGIGHFYTGRILIGFSKLFFFMIFLSTLLLFYNEVQLKIKFPRSLFEYKQNIHQSPIKKFQRLLKYVVFFFIITTFSIWFVYDLINFCLNKNVDGRGVVLYSMYNP